MVSRSSFHVGIANAWCAYVEFTEGSGTEVESLQRFRQWLEKVRLLCHQKGRNISKSKRGFPSEVHDCKERHRDAY
jgi:hypothetical protein